MPAPGRQIEGIRPETPVQELAHAAIVQRLAAVATHFPLAAGGTIGDDERVHQLRVATRRAVAALELFDDFSPPRRTKRLIGKLKSIRRAAGKARDLDVLMAQLGTSSQAPPGLLQRLSEQRHAAQEEIVDLFERHVPNERLANCVQSVTDRIRPRSKKARKGSRKPIEIWAPKRLQKAATEFLKTVPDSLDRPTALHALRIEGKRLRYTLELLASGIATVIYHELYPLLEQLQDRLGAINDHRVAIERLATHSTEAGEQIKNERTAMQDEIDQFGPWLHDTFLPRFQRVIEETERDTQ